MIDTEVGQQSYRCQRPAAVRAPDPSTQDGGHSRPAGKAADAGVEERSGIAAREQDREPGGHYAEERAMNTKKSTMWSSIGDGGRASPKRWLYLWKPIGS
jgi:hypothetical protein